MARDHTPNGTGPAPRTRSLWLLGLLDDERVRFLIVGGFNTLFGYALFVVFELVTGPQLGYFFSLYASFSIACLVAFVLHRYYTFRAHDSGNIFIDFVRFVSVYIVTLVLNSIALPLLVEAVGMSPLLAQGLIVLVTTLTSYFGHKYFSFRRRRMESPRSSADQFTTP